MGVRRWLTRAIVALLVIAIVLPVTVTAIYRFVPPPITILMVQRLWEGRGLNKQWRPLSQISPSLVQAVIASEDAQFCSHRGFDFEAIEKALANNARRPNAVRGASTISQQTAKNVFLWPARSWVRKGAEAYFTVLIETMWGKRRIMEVYLNVAEWGAGTYGAEGAARRYFETSAAKLTRAQAARLAAVLPNPIKFNAARPGPGIARRSRTIRSRATTVRQSDLADCVLG
jgi:monofunctional biosynthetic peptidoglycan transglycosylase